MACSAIVLALVVLACGGDDSGVEDSLPTITAPENIGMTAPTEAPVDEPESEGPPEADVVENCEGEPTVIDVNDTVNGELVGDGIPRDFYCMVIPAEVRTITLDLTGLTDDVSLYVGYGTEEALQGGLAYWSSTSRDADAQTILIEPGFFRDELGGFVQAEFVTRGAYYVEVSGNESPYRLAITLGR